MSRVELRRRGIERRIKERRRPSSERQGQASALLRLAAICSGNDSHSRVGLEAPGNARAMISWATQGEGNAATRVAVRRS